MALKRRYARLMVYTSNIIIAVSIFIPKILQWWTFFFSVYFWPEKKQTPIFPSKYWQVETLHDRSEEPQIANI